MHHAVTATASESECASVCDFPVSNDSDVGAFNENAIGTIRKIQRVESIMDFLHI